MGPLSRHRCAVLVATALIAGGLLGYASAPEPPPAAEKSAGSDEAADPRVLRLQQELARLERQLATEERRRRALEQRADALFELLQTLHQELAQER